MKMFRQMLENKTLNMFQLLKVDPHLSSGDVLVFNQTTTNKNRPWTEFTFRLQLHHKLIKTEHCNSLSKNRNRGDLLTYSSKCLSFDMTHKSLQNQETQALFTAVMTKFSKLRKMLKDWKHSRAL